MSQTKFEITIRPDPMHVDLLLFACPLCGALCSWPVGETTAAIDFEYCICGATWAIPMASVEPLPGEIVQIRQARKER